MTLYYDDGECGVMLMQTESYNISIKDVMTAAKDYCRKNGLGVPHYEHFLITPKTPDSVNPTMQINQNPTDCKPNN